jgi:hypothetical protein
MTLDFLKQAKDTSSFPLIFVWGLPNVGKTVFALTCPGPILFIDIERKSIEYSRQQVTEHQTTDFTILEYSDVGDLYQKLKQLDDAGYLDGGHFKTVVVDSGTRVWADVQTEYEEEKKLGKDKDGDENLFANATQLLEWRTIKGPLQRIMTKIRNSPMVRVITAHETDLIDKDTKKIVGKTFKMEKSITYDANIQLRLFVDGGVYKAEVLRDNTNLFPYKNGRIPVIENPHYGLWAKFYESGGKNPTARQSLKAPPPAPAAAGPSLDDKVAACFSDPEIIEMMGMIGMNQEAATGTFKYYKGDVEVVKERLRARMAELNKEDL